MKTELDVLVEQLDELLAAPIVDTDDAIEVAIVAGLAARLGASPAQLADAVIWRDSVGRALVGEMWEEVDLDPLLEELDACSMGGATDEAVEEALFDIDDIVAAAIWCRQTAKVKAGARRAAEIIRAIPDLFAPMSDLALQVARLRDVALHLDLYDYWLAVADAGSVR